MSSLPLHRHRHPRRGCKPPASRCQLSAWRGMPSRDAAALPKPVTRNPRGEALRLRVKSTLTMGAVRLSAATWEVQLPGSVLPHTTAPRRRRRGDRRACVLRGRLLQQKPQSRQTRGCRRNSLARSPEFGKSGDPTPSSAWPASWGHAAGRVLSGSP